MESSEIYVEMGEMEKAMFPDMLRSGGLGLCVAIAFYRPPSKSGYLLHEHRNDALEAHIERVRQDYKDLSKVRVFVTGNSVYRNSEANQQEYDLSIRPEVERVLGQHFRPSQIRVKWLPKNHLGELYLDTATGKFEVETEPVEDVF